MTPQQKIKAWREDPALFVREQFHTEPDAWQLEALAAFADPLKPRISLQACAGPGKLQPKSMMLYTPDGERRFGDLKVGDRVFTRDGSSTRVTGVYDNGVMPMYRVWFNDGSSTLAGAEHLWKVRGRTERRYWKDDQKPQSKRSRTYSERNRTIEVDWEGYAVLTTQQIMARNRCPDGQRRQFEIPTQGAVQFPQRPLELHPYVLGVWLGDGTRNGGHYTGIDPEIDAEVSMSHRVTARGQKKSVKGLLPSLRVLGVLDTHSYERFIPDAYKTAIFSHRQELLRGLMDTDGCIGTDGHCEYTTTSARLAADIAWLVRSLGGVARLKPSHPKKSYKKPDGTRVECRECYRVTVTTPFCPFIVKRKASRWKRPHQRYLTRYIDRIEEALPEDSMCIQVANASKCYLCNDFIVTHNTACLAWCIWNFLSCYAGPGEHPKGAAVSITSDNLKDNLWPELAKWQAQSPFLTAAFTWNKQQITANDHPSTWFFSFRSWPKSASAEEQGKTLSGLHGQFVLSVIDESGGIPTTVLRAAEQSLSTCTFGKILQAGNPISLEGMLYAASTKLAHQWHVIRITGDPDDPNRSPRINKEWAQHQIDAYGRDNPWVMSYILGKFPPSSLNSLIGPEDVQAAFTRQYDPQIYTWAQSRLGVDVARYGDDRTVIFPRQGKRAFAPTIMRHGRDTAVSTDIATKVLEQRLIHRAEATIMDATGGWAAGASDVLRASGSVPVNVQFHAAGLDGKYKNRRAEMWFAMCEWVKAGGWLPNLQELIAELSTPTYTFVNGKFQLEPKEQVKERLGRSPDLADALALTFGVPEALPRQQVAQYRPSGAWS